MQCPQPDRERGVRRLIPTFGRLERLEIDRDGLRWSREGVRPSSREGSQGRGGSWALSMTWRSKSLARSIARKLEDDLQYPGQIEVTVIREYRAKDYAR